MRWELRTRFNTLGCVAPEFVAAYSRSSGVPSHLLHPLAAEFLQTEFLALSTLVASSDGDTGLRAMAQDEVEGFVSAPSSRGTLGTLPPMVLGPTPPCSVNPKSVAPTFKR